MKIELSARDWLWNAGVAGLYGILENAGDKVEADNMCIAFDSEALDGLEIKFFNFLNEKYRNILPFQKMLKKRGMLDLYKSIGKLEKKEIELLNENIELFSRKAASSSFSSAYPHMGEGTEEKIKSILKKLKKVKPKTSPEEIREKIKLMEELLDILDQKVQGKHFIAAKDVAYNVINRAWDNITFFHASKMKKDIFECYKDFFITPAKKYIEKLEKGEIKDDFTCDLTSYPAEYNRELSLYFMIGAGYDIKRKTSNSWNYINQMVVSELALLVYSCVPAGFTYFGDSGIFINASSSINEMIRVNSVAAYKILSPGDDFGGQHDIMNAVVDAINDYRYEASDIQVIRMKDRKYNFLLLPQALVKILVMNREKLNFLKNKWYKSNGKGKSEIRNIYSDVISCLVEERNLQALLLELIKSKGYVDSGNFYSAELLKILEIILTLKKKKKGKNMAENGNETKALYYIRRKGIEFRRKYIATTGNENKFRSLLYRLSEDLRAENIKGFFDEVISSHLYINDEIDPSLLKMLSGKEEFLSIAYSFMAGMLGESKNRNEEKDDEGEEDEKDGE